MSIPEWRDTTSYQRGERGKTDPREWCISFADLTIFVHRLVHRDGWFLRCVSLNIRSYPLGVSTADWAKERALKRCRLVAVARLADIDTIIEHNPHRHGVGP